MVRRPKHNPTPTPPAGLSEPAATWWEATRAEYSIDDAAGLALLNQAAQALDRADAARTLLEAEGLVVRDRFDQPKPHPASVIVRDAEASFRSALRDLRLDVEPSRPPGRPAGI